VEAVTDEGVRIAYERTGSGAGEPLLLVMGLGMQMIAWPRPFCDLLGARGFDVVRFDNRDTGCSSHFPAAGTPSLARLLLRPASVAAYSLTDMAGDAFGLMDTLGWDSAHVVGASLGGMIAQTMAITRPDRVRSLTSMMSTPSVRVGRPRLAALAALASPHVDDRERAGERSVKVFRVIGTGAYPLDEDAVREGGRLAYDRNFDPGGARRQLAAAAAAADRRPALARVRVPTLVLHGEADPLVRVSGGRATAAAVPGARLVTYPGMAHAMPPALWPSIVGEIARVAGLD
jgi:pimeloyl-ACP methyl ester carboxylesterase